MMKQMNKSGQFLPRDWVISLVLFSGLMSLLILMVASQSFDYGNPGIVDENIQSNFGNLSEATSIGSNAFDAASEKGGLSFTGSFDVLFDSAFTIISLVFGSIGIVAQQLSDFGEYAGVPTVVAQILFPLLISIATIILVFAIISTTSRKDF